MATDTNVITATPMSLEAQVAAVTAKVDMIVGEMRDRDNRRAAEIAELRKKHDEDIKEITSATDAKILHISNSIDSMTKHVQILSMTAMGGIIAAGVGIAAMVWTVINK